MVVSGNDHLNDSNYCNCAAIEHYSRFQIDNGTNGVLWVWYVRAVWGQNYRVRILHKKKKHCQSSQLLLFLLLHLLFLSSPSWPVSPPPSSSSISSSTYTPHGSAQFCSPHVPPPPHPSDPLPFSLWLLSTAVWRADWSSERQWGIERETRKKICREKVRNAQ